MAAVVVEVVKAAKLNGDGDLGGGDKVGEKEVDDSPKLGIEPITRSLSCRGSGPAFSSLSPPSPARISETETTESRCATTILIANGLLGVFGDFTPPPMLRLVLRGDERKLKELGFLEASVDGGLGIGLGAVGIGGFEIGPEVEGTKGGAAEDTIVSKDEEAGVSLDEDEVRVVVDEEDDSGGIDEVMDVSDARTESEVASGEGEGEENREGAS